ncbi:MAG: TetR/AcrR family transcriptional regulator [Desulforegulaceae bacterium]|nr:TetR/AcrR family transcriptional regulator [Desulforegulaceae bacterium]
MEKLTRKQKEIKRRKLDIIEAALICFAKKSFHGATMSEISTQSELPLATIYSLFKSKENIYFELLKIKGKELTKTIKEAIENKETHPLERLRKGMNEHYFFCLENKDFTKIYLQERQGFWELFEENLKYEIKILVEKLLSLFTDVFNDGIDKGYFKSYSTKELSELFISIITSSASSWIINREDNQKFKQRLDNGFQIFTSGLLKNKKSF